MRIDRLRDGRADRLTEGADMTKAIRAFRDNGNALNQKFTNNP